MITPTTIVLPDAAVDETSSSPKGAGLLITATDSKVEFGVSRFGVGSDVGSVVGDEVGNQVGARDVGLEVGSDVGDAVGGNDGEYVSFSNVG